MWVHIWVHVPAMYSEKYTCTTWTLLRVQLQWWCCLYLVPMHFNCWCSDRSTCSMHVIYMLLYSSVLSMPNIGMHEPVMWDGSDSCCSVCTYICFISYIIMCSPSNKGEHIVLSSWSSYHREQPVSSQKCRLGTLGKSLNLLVIMVNPWGHEACVGQYRGD